MARWMEGMLRKNFVMAPVLQRVGVERQKNVARDFRRLSEGQRCDVAVKVGGKGEVSWQKVC